MSLNKKLLRSLIEELWQVRNPHLKNPKKEELKELEQKIEQQRRKEASSDHNLGVHSLLSRKAFFELVTNRNRNLINIEEQNKLKNTVVGFFGLSVGSHGVLTWMMQSRADFIKISDFDKVSASNLNRANFGIDNIGKSKGQVVAEKIGEINPFAKVYLFLKPDSIEEIFLTPPKVNVIVDEIDSFEGKIALRKMVRKLYLPLISVADVGDNVIVDVERYDLKPLPEMFLGRIKNIENIDFSKLTDLQKKKMIIELVGFDHNSERMIDSLFSIGGSTVTWPQLGATATISGGVITTLIKKIVLGEKVLSGRYNLSLDEMFVSNFNDASIRAARNKKIRQFKKVLSKI